MTRSARAKDVRAALVMGAGVINVGKREGIITHLSAEGSNFSATHPSATLVAVLFQSQLSQ